MADSKITDLAAIAAVVGTEEYVVNDGGNDKKATSAQTWAYIKGEIQGSDVLAAIGTDDSFLVLENDDTLEECTFEVVEAAINAAMWAESNVATLADADAIIVRDGGIAGTDGTATLTTLATYMLAELEPSILDISDKDASATPADAHLMLTVSGTTPKKTTFLQVKNSILGGFDTYMNALAAVTVPADTDVLYCTQAGTEKKMTLLQIVNHIDYPINGSGAAGYLADWSDADTLQNTYLMVTSFIAGSNTEVATSKACRDEMDEIINDATAMAAAIVNADTILMDDGAGGTQRKATFTQMKTWFEGEYQDLAATAAPEFTALKLAASTEVTISAGGAAAVTQAFHTLDTNADGATDDLTSFTGLVAGTWYTFMAEHTDRSVVFKHQANIFCEGAADLTMDSTNDLIKGFSPDGTVLICHLVQTD